MRILITGGRDFTDFVTMMEAFQLLGLSDQPATIIEGCAAGADSLAEQLAPSFGWTVEHHPARWDELGKAAGVIRNDEMLRTGIDLCLAFHTDLKESKGTLDMVEKCLRAGVPTRLYPRTLPITP